MAGDFSDIPFVPAAGDGGLRPTTQMVVIHATDNTASDVAEASYATHRADEISAHFYSDEDSVTQAVPLANVAFGCYPIGNSRSVQFELVGLSNRLTDATLRRIAPIVRRVCDRYGLPIRHVGAAELRSGARGICGHADVTLAWGQGSHTDPGADFPWATFISYVQQGGDMLEGIDRAQLNNAEQYPRAIIEWTDQTKPISDTSDVLLPKPNRFKAAFTTLANDVATIKARPAAEVDVPALATALTTNAVLVDAIATAVADKLAARLRG